MLFYGCKGRTHLRAENFPESPVRHSCAGRNPYEIRDTSDEIVRRESRGWVWKAVETPKRTIMMNYKSYGEGGNGPGEQVGRLERLGRYGIERKIMGEGGRRQDIVFSSLIQRRS